jgi:hypothetical protein
MHHRIDGTIGYTIGFNIHRRFKLRPIIAVEHPSIFDRSIDKRHGRWTRILWILRLPNKRNEFFQTCRLSSFTLEEPSLNGLDHGTILIDRLATCFTSRHFTVLLVDLYAPCLSNGEHEATHVRTVTIRQIEHRLRGLDHFSGDLVCLGVLTPKHLKTTHTREVIGVTDGRIRDLSTSCISC